MSNLSPKYVITEACPNYDFDPRSHEATIKIKPKKNIISSFKEASDLCRKFKADNDLGGGNWCGGDILDSDNNIIANVSYNGRVWEIAENTTWRNRREISIETGKIV